MPVKCVLQNGKYRVVGPDGKVETNKSGTAVDGGGHASMDACRKQASAINMNLSYEKSVIHYEGQQALAVSSQSDDTQVFKKDMISLGTYVHPVHKWKLNVTLDRMKKWVSAFSTMKENGVDVEVPLDHSLSAGKNIGYLKDMMIEGGTLFGILEIRGQDSIDIVRRNKNVSVWIAQDYKDGKGNSYGEVIKHCSVVQQPVVPQQADFIPIAASQAGIDVTENVPIYFSKRSETMTKEQLDKLKTLFGLGDDATEETVLSLIEKQTKEQSEKLSSSQEENIALKSQLDKSKAASKIDPNTLELAGTTIEDRIAMLTEKGNITPAVAKKLSTILVGPQGNRNEFSLSLGENQSPSIASQVVDALKGNDPVKLGEHTKSQVLSREEPGGEEVKADEEGGAAMLSGAGVVEES